MQRKYFMKYFSRFCGILFLVMGLCPWSVQAQTNTPVSLNKNFANVCYFYNTSDAAGVPQVYRPPQLSVPRSDANPAGPCYMSSPTMFFSVSHETLQNDHSGDLNNGYGNAHTGDYVHAQDFGKWVNAALYGNIASQTLGMALDTINFFGVTPTGRPIQNGHLFFGFNDMYFYNTAKFLDNEIYAEFDIRLRGVEERQTPFTWSVSGQRVMFGILSNWIESGRTNISHFTEIDLYKSPLYTFGETLDPIYCADAPYDRCYFDRAGNYSEGRYVGYQTFLQGGNSIALNLGTDNWTHVRLPLSQLIRSLNWVSKPTSWHNATLQGIYIGIESMGASRTWIEVQNYNVYMQTQNPSVFGLPLGLVRAGSAGLLSNPSGICLLQDGAALANWSFSQRDYDIAPQITIPAGYQVPKCPTLPSPFRALFRVGNAAYLQQSNFYCLFASPAAAFQRGYTQSDYNAAPQVFLADKNLVYTGSCRN